MTTGVTGAFVQVARLVIGGTGNNAIESFPERESEAGVTHGEGLTSLSVRLLGDSTARQRALESAIVALERLHERRIEDWPLILDGLETLIVALTPPPPAQRSTRPVLPLAA